MSAFFDFVKTLIEKYGLKSLISFVLSIFTVTIIPRQWIDKLPFNDINIYWAMAVSFAIWIIVLHSIILICRRVKNKIYYSSYKDKSIKENNRKNLERLWTRVDQFSENDRKDIMNFLETNNKPISKGGTPYDGLYNSEFVIKTEKRTLKEEEVVVYGTNEKMKMQRYDTHVYKLKEPIYELLKYSQQEYGKICHFE